MTNCLILGSLLVIFFTTSAKYGNASSSLVIREITHFIPFNISRSVLEFNNFEISCGRDPLGVSVNRADAETAVSIVNSFAESIIDVILENESLIV